MIIWKGVAAGCLSAVAVVIGGCDPCAGVVSCREEPRISYSGQTVRHGTREPVAGVRVSFVRESGISLDGDTVSALTAADGRFELVANTEGEGEVYGHVVVHPPSPLAPYRIPDVTLRTTRTRGDGYFFPDQWVVDPYIDYRGELFLRGKGTPPPTSEVQFLRTGGVRVDPDTFTGSSDGNTGRFEIRTKALEIGELQGELRVRIPGYSGVYEVANVRVSTRYTEGNATFVGRWGVGPHLPYAGLLRYADTKSAAAGVEVEIRRVGGISMEPDRIVTRTNEFGTFGLGGVVSGDGTVVVELVIRPAPPYRPVTIPRVELATTGQDVQGVLVGQWEIPREVAAIP